MKMPMKASTKTSVRAAALCLAACILPSALAPKAFAAPPQVAVDETVYVNLDYYGGVSQMSIVKACDLNGVTSFTDYGEYEKVQNMSNQIEPQLSQGGVAWELADAGGRFYYECTPKNQDIGIPWSFDISYELDGVPKRAEDIAGKAGLVTVRIEAIPNERTNDYYKENMVLMAGMLVNTEDIKSFKAPGAQVQTIGSNQAAFYMATPGQHTTFHFYIGTDSFETIGAVLAMVPATLSQLDETGRIRDDKENVKNAARALDDTLDDILDTLDNLAGGLKATQGGLVQLNEARQAIYDAKGSLYESSGGMRDSMAKLTRSLHTLGGVLGDNQGTLYELGNDIGDVAESLSDMQGEIDRIMASLNRLDNYFGQLKDCEEDAVEELLQKIRDEIGNLKRLLSGVSGKVDTDALLDKVRNVSDKLGDMPYLTIGSSDAEDLIASLRAILSGMVGELRAISGAISGTVDKGHSVIGGIGEMKGSVKHIDSSLNEILRNTDHTLRVTGNLLDSISVFIEDVENTLKGCDEKLNAGTKQTLDGLTQFLGQAVDGLGKTEDLRKNKDIITDVIEDEWNRLEGDFGLLDIDTGAKKVSFTSQKNPEPNSLQIVLRTQEIKAGEAQAVDVDLETDAENIGVINRVKMIFVKIWDSVTGLFS